MGNLNRRILKFKQKDQAEEKVGERVTARPYQEMIELVLKKQLDSKTLNEKEVRILVDCLAIDNENAKSLAGKVTLGKPVLLDWAREHGVHELHGDESLAKIGDGTVWDLPASKAIKILEKEGKLKLLDEVLSVRVTEFRKYLGSDLFEGKAEKTVKEFSSISLRKK